MDYETIVAIENFIENLSNPRKQRIVRELVVNSNFEISQKKVFDKTELLIAEKNNKTMFLLSSYVHTRCNCGK